MKFKILLLIVAVMLVFGADTANATSPYNLAINQSGPVDVTGETTVFFDVVFNPGVSVTLDTYTYNILYDPGELTWNSGLTNWYAETPLIAQLLGPLDVSTPGVIGNINAAYFGPGPVVSSPLLLAELAFDVGSPVLNGSLDVEFDRAYDVRYGFTINGSNVLMSDIPIGSEGPDVYTSVVPEPISAALFIIGGAALGFRRFRKSITN